MSDNSAPSPPPAPSSAAPPRRGRHLPGPFIWTVVAVCLIGVVTLPFLVDGSRLRHDQVVVLSAVLLAVVATTLLVWFIVVSGYAAATRMLVAGIAILGIALPASLFRLKQVSGDLVPEWTFRWTPEADRTLDRPAPAAAPTATGVDLGTTTADDVPQFLGPQRDNTISAAAFASDWSRHPPRLVWKREIGAGWSGFSVVNGYAVTMEQRGDEELVTCYEVATGQIQWYHAVATRHQTAMGGSGPRATPTIHQGKVFALGANGHLRCLDGATGRELWHDDILARIGVTPGQDLAGIAWGRSASPLIVDDLVVVPWGGPNSGPWISLAAYDANSGEVVWTGGNRQISYSSPTLATLCGVRQILLVSEAHAGGYDPQTGKPLWETDWPGDSSGNASVSQPVAVGEDRVLLTKGYSIGAKLVQIARADSPDAAWRVDEVWSNRKVLLTKFSNVVVREGYAYGLSDAILECTRLEDGKRQWKSGRYGQGQMLGVGPWLLIQAESGQVVLLAAGPEGPQELASLPALEGKTWNNPCLFGRYLLVRNAEQAACYELDMQ